MLRKICKDFAQCRIFLASSKELPNNLCCCNLTLLVLQGLTHRKKLCAYTCNLSTHSSNGAFVPTMQVFHCTLGKDWLFSGMASCLDAFSSYPLQRSYPALPCQTTGTPVAATSCSSRTRDIFPSVNQQLQQIVSKLARTVLNPTNVRL